VPRSRRLIVALVASLVLHLAVLAWLMRARTPREAPSPEPMRVEVFVVPPAEPPRPAPVPSLVTPPRAKAPPSVAPRTVSPRAAGPAAPTKPEPPAAGPTKPPADAPRALSLMPRLPLGDDTSGTVEVPGGRTLRNEPGAPVDTGPTAEQQAQAVTHMLQDDMAARRVATGAVDDYYREMRRALEGAARTPPPIDPKRLEAKGQADYRKGRRNWGASGNPYGAEGPPMREDLDAISELNTWQENQIGRPGSMLEGFNAAQMLATRRDFGGASGPVLPTAVIEIQRRRDGTLVSVKLLTTSGVKEFDQYVLQQATEATRGFALPPERIRTDPTRTVWAFTDVIAGRESRCRVELLRVY